MLVLAAPIAVAAVWGRWMTLKSSARVRDPWSLVIAAVLANGRRPFTSR